MVFGACGRTAEWETIVPPKGVDIRVALEGNIHEHVVGGESKSSRFCAVASSFHNGKVLASAVTTMNVAIAATVLAKVEDFALSEHATELIGLQVELPGKGAGFGKGTSRKI